MTENNSIVSHDCEILLSIVIPSYNEQLRLPATLKAVHDFLISQKYPSEVIIADDGSDDLTVGLAEDFATMHSKVTVLRLPHRGKAATVRDGVLAARGRYVMFTDADLPTPMKFATDLIRALDDGASVAIGSREGEDAHRIGEPGYRHAMGRVFNKVVRLVAVPGIDDTQCGFKAFRHDAAEEIFNRVLLYSDGSIVVGPRVTAFDVEVLFIAQRLGYKIAEIPVTWSHVSGSKVRPIRDALRMFMDVVQVRINAIRGRYN